VMPAECNGSVTNSVTVTANVLGCPQTASANAQASIACTPPPQVTVTKTANQQSACAGAAVGFVIHVRNGSAAPESVFFADTFNGSPIAVPGILLAARGAFAMPFRAVMPPECNGSVTNSVVVTANVLGCPQTASASAQASIACI